MQATEPVACQDRFTCESGFCGDPKTGLLVGIEGHPVGTPGTCCATSEFTNGLGITGCDNVCGGQRGCWGRLLTAHLESLLWCGDVCTADAECKAGAYCDPSDSTCTPRACDDCWLEGADCFYDSETCGVECRTPICGVPCTTQADCAAGSCQIASSGEMLCLPTQCPGCWNRDMLCGYDEYTCAFNECAGCIANCERKTCGSDGCAGSCGDCATGEVCVDNNCVACPDEGQECDPGVPDCARYVIRCDSGEPRCVRTQTGKSGEPCQIGDLAGVCTAQASCRSLTEVPPEPEDPMTEEGTLASCSLPCLSVAKFFSNTALDQDLCGPDGKAYWSTYQNDCSFEVYCALCAKTPSGQPTDCVQDVIAPGARVNEWANRSNAHCLGEMQGSHYNCVQSTDTHCRLLLINEYEKYPPH